MSRLSLALLLLGCGVAPAPPTPTTATTNGDEAADDTPRTDERLARAQLLITEERYDEAEALLRGLVGDPAAAGADRGEALWRIGELDFELGRLDGAEAAYGHLLAGLDADSEWYPVVAYKWAWTAYRDQRFADALARFTQVVTAAPATNDLRAESLQYLAIVVAERDWNDDGTADPTAGLTRPEVAQWLASAGTAPWVDAFLAALISTCDDLSDVACADEARAFLAARP